MFLIFLTSVHALTLNLNQTEINKEDTLQILGECDEGSIKIYANNYDRFVFEKSLECDEFGKYFAEYEVSFLDPEGYWEIYSEQGNELKSQKILVKSTKKSKFLVITFLSPGKESYYKNEDLDISVKITDAGNAVEDAEVIFWDLEGQKQKLEYQNTGIYSAEYTIPLDANTAEWQIRITAEEKTETDKIGGDAKLDIEIENSKFKINVLKPDKPSIETGSQLIVEAEITYFNNKEFDGETKVQIGNYQLTLDKKTNKLYSGSLFVSDEYLGLENIIISVEDKFGNHATEEVNLLVTSGFISSLISETGYFILAFILIVILGLVIYPRFKKNLESHNLQKEKKHLNSQIKELQKDYFERNKIQKNTYNKKLAEFESRKAEIEKILNRR
ncbi:MAG: hypothetical protein V1672_03500 [Candidatus Diapherotrites archaeon]